MRSRLIIAVQAITIVILLGWVGIGYVDEYINRGLRFTLLRDARSVSTALEAYRSDLGHYPTTFDVSELRAALVPKYIGQLQFFNITYFSAGTDYGLILESFGRRTIEIRSDRVVRYPEDWYSPEIVDAFSETLRLEKQRHDSQQVTRTSDSPR